MKLRGGEAAARSKDASSRTRRAWRSSAKGCCRTPLVGQAAKLDERTGLPRRYAPRNDGMAKRQSSRARRAWRSSAQGHDGIEANGRVSFFGEATRKDCQQLGFRCREFGRIENRRGSRGIGLHSVACTAAPGEHLRGRRAKNPDPGAKCYFTASPRRCRRTVRIGRIRQWGKC